MIIFNEISDIQDYKAVIEMIKKSKSLSHEAFKVSRLAFAHPVGKLKFSLLMVNLKFKCYTQSSVYPKDLPLSSY